MLDTLASRIMFQDIGLVKLPYEWLHVDSRTRTTVLSDIGLQLEISNSINIDANKAQILSGHILVMIIFFFSFLLS